MPPARKVEGGDVSVSVHLDSALAAHREAHVLEGEGWEGCASADRLVEAHGPVLANVPAQGPGEGAGSARVGDHSRWQGPGAALNLLAVVQERHGVAGDRRVGAEHSAVEQVSVRGMVLVKQREDREAARVACAQFAQPRVVGDPLPGGHVNDRAERQAPAGK